MTRLPVTRYRRIEDMPRPWRSTDDPDNLKVVAQMLTFYRSLARKAPRCPGVQKFRAAEDAEASADRDG